VSNDGSVAFLSDATGLTGFDGDDPPGAKPNYTDVYVALPSGSVVKASMSNSTYQAADGSTHQSPATGDSYRPSISADGTKVAFASDATNLPTSGADQNPDTDVFLRDIPGSSVKMVNQPPSGVPGGASTAPAISGDGSAVAFASAAPNLVPGDNNGVPDVFVANAGNGGISRVNVRPGADGFQPDGPSYLPGLSSNGLIVAFGSSATNLVDGDPGRRGVRLRRREVLRLRRGDQVVQADRRHGVHAEQWWLLALRVRRRHLLLRRCEVPWLHRRCETEQPDRRDGSDAER
jgi:hypothetical protein